VPLEVMLGQYGCDDMEFLLGQASKPGTIQTEKVVEAVDGKGQRVYDTRVYHLPVSRFDNREDLTTFVRKPRAEWQADEVAKIHKGLSAALQHLANG